jgi:hypothetical protein
MKRIARNPQEEPNRVSHFPSLELCVACLEFFLSRMPAILTKGDARRHLVVSEVLDELFKICVTHMRDKKVTD